MHVRPRHALSWALDPSGSRNGKPSNPPQSLHTCIQDSIAIPHKGAAKYMSICLLFMSHQTHPANKPNKISVRVGTALLNSLCAIGWVLKVSVCWLCRLGLYAGFVQNWNKNVSWTRPETMAADCSGRFQHESHEIIKIGLYDGIL